MIFFDLDSLPLPGLHLREQLLRPPRADLADGRGHLAPVQLVAELGETELADRVVGPPPAVRAVEGGEATKNQAPVVGEPGDVVSGVGSVGIGELIEPAMSPFGAGGSP
jgi:hypothetical protein